MLIKSNEYTQANLEDGAQIADVYNYYVQNTHHTFETEPLGADEMQNRISEVTENYPFLVAEEDGAIVGYAHATQFKLRQAYEYAAEVSIYVRNAAKQKGIGSQLYMKLFEELAKPIFTPSSPEFLCRMTRAFVFTKD